MFTYRKERTPFMKRKKGLTRLYQTFAFLMVRMTGFDSRRTTPAVIRGSNSHLGCYSLPLLLQTHHPHKQKRHNHKAVPLLLVRMTGFEPTRLSTLEPETSASAVPPHPHIRGLALRPRLLYHRQIKLSSEICYFA